MNEILFVSLFVSFFVSLLIMPIWIKKCRQIGLLWEDMNKLNHPKKVASSGGIVVVIAFVLGVLSYVAIRTFLFGNGSDILLSIFSLLSVILLLALVGLTDDLLGWHHGGLSARSRVILAFMASIPLVVLNVGVHTIGLPFFGTVDLGLWYPLFLVPLGIAGATTTYNFLAGMNGLEAGQGMIILTFLSFVAYATGSAWLAMIGLCMVAALFGFYIYNKVPAKAFPGDIMTYSVGALIACMAILGNFEKIAVFVFIPYIIETILKVRGGLRKESFGIPQDKGGIKMPYKKVYGLTHISIWLLSKVKKKVYEEEVTYVIFAFQIFICLLALIIFRGALF